MNGYARSDLACESACRSDRDDEGEEWRERRVGNFTVRSLRILSGEAAKRLQKPCGTYVTVECGKLNLVWGEKRRMLEHLLAGELRGMAERLTGKLPNPDFSVFVAGLGNVELTADALGPKTVSRLTATRHLRKHESGIYQKIGCSSLSALAPGVLGQTGMETLELLQSVTNCIKPDLVVVVDALAARSCERLASTIQLSDAGIEPGSGVGNHRAPITRQTLGVPVAVLGAPTVVDSATLVWDALDQAGIKEPDEALRRVLETGKSFFVSPKESDVICDRVARVFADAISLAFVGVSDED
ncbi:MAG: GPR endopeptidase [Clostridia bacterium]|nr:GPR endopeptidase [Clostridia bacterium]